MSVALDRDLETAGHLQRTLLPPSTVTAAGWTIVHHYQPAGVVSGDYLDLVPHGGRLYFMLGDVSGKGVAASMLMAQLHTMFRSLIPFGLSLEELMARASALLCASSLPAQYATLVCGFLEPTGEVVIANAGHPPPLIISGHSQVDVHATGVPIGMFCESRFSTTQLNLAGGDALLIYSDGLTEATNGSGQEYGTAQVEVSLRRHAGGDVGQFVDGLVADHAAFRAGRPNDDDLTILAIRRLRASDDGSADSSGRHRCPQ